MILVVFDPVTRLVKRIVIPGPGEKIHPDHVQRGERSITLPMTGAFSDPFNRAAFNAGLANYGLVIP